MADGGLKKRSRNDVVSAEAPFTDKKREVNLWIVLVSIVFIVLLGYLNIPALFTSGLYGLSTDWWPSSAGLAIVILMLLYNMLAKKFWKGKGLVDQKSMVTAYIMVSLAGFIFSVPLVSNLPISMAALYQFSLASPEWFGGYFDAVSPLVHIKDADAAMSFWLGAESVPWNVWIVPLILWTLVFAAILFVMISIVTLVRRMWTEHERLSFPLTLPILAMTKLADEERHVLGAFWRNKLMYVGFVPPVIFGLMNILRDFFPVIPSIAQYKMVSAQGFFAQPPWNVLAQFPLPLAWAWSFLLLGIAYFVPLDLGFSIWFSYWMILLLKVLLENAGLWAKGGWQIPEVGNLSSMVGLGIFSLWLCRAEIKRFFMTAIRGSKIGGFDDSDEPLSVRVALIGGIIAIAYIIFFCTALLKVPVLVAIGYFLLAFSAIVTYARIRAEAGLPHSGTMHYLAIQYAAVFGGQEILGANTLGLGHFWCLEYGGFGAIGGIALDAYRMADEIKLKRRTLTKIIFLTYFIAASIGFFIVLRVIYEYGMFNLEYQRVNEASLSAFQYFIQMLRGSSGAGTTSWGPFIAVVSILLTFFLYFMRIRYVWWPFHPAGLVLGCAQNIINIIWLPIFLMWLVKFIMNRYGGVALIEKYKPVFMGLIIGDVCIGIVSVIVSNIAILLG